MFTTSLTFVDIVKQPKDSVMVLLLEEDSWLYRLRGDKMEVLTLTEVG